MRENIDGLIEMMNDQFVTAYTVSKVTGVSQYQLSLLKNGKSKVGNLSLDSAEKLSAFYEEIQKDIEEGNVY